jgi:hypothetical protein
MRYKIVRGATCQVNGKLIHVDMTDQMVGASTHCIDLDPDPPSCRGKDLILQKCGLLALAHANRILGCKIVVVLFPIAPLADAQHDALQVSKTASIQDRLQGDLAVHI